MPPSALPEPESDGPSLPPRHRPNKDSLNTDTTERGFWDLDDPLDDETSAPAPAKVEPRRSMPALSAAEASPRQDPVKPSGESVPILPSRNNVSRRISNLERFRNSRDAKAGPLSESDAGPPFVPSGDAMEKTFDELEHWDVSEEPVQSPTRVEAEFEGFADFLDLKPVSKPEDPAPARSLAPVEPADQAMAEFSAPPAGATPDFDNLDNEFGRPINPDAKPVSLLPHLKLTVFERLGMACLVLALLAGGFWIYRNTITRIGHSGASHGQAEYPVQGKHITVSKVVSYWRAPISSGDQQEIVRRGVVLIPVVEITLSGGSGAVRIDFSNEPGKTTGDPIIRTVNGGTTLIVPATDGFEDISMHAAYRTDLAKPWFLQISEAPSENSPRAQFKELLRVPISAEKR